MTRNKGSIHLLKLKCDNLPNSTRRNLKCFANLSNSSNSTISSGYNELKSHNFDVSLFIAIVHSISTRERRILHIACYLIILRTSSMHSAGVVAINILIFYDLMFTYIKINCCMLLKILSSQ